MAHRGPDPRHWQLAVLGTLLCYGLFALDFEVRAATAAAAVGTSLLAEWLIAHRTRRRFDPRSPLISALSLCLLLRTDSIVLAAAAGAIAIGSKALVRVRGRHVFNPSALALVVLLLTTERAWVSSGQWGHVALFAWAVAGMGGLVVHRAARSDVTLAFLGTHAALLFGRALRLGDPLAIPLHQLQSGALLLFAFHMISDPKTTPGTRAGRIAFAIAVACGAHAVRFVLFEPNGPLYALVAAAPLVPLFDRLFPAPPAARVAERRGSPAPLPCPASGALARVPR